MDDQFAFICASMQGIKGNKQVAVGRGLGIYTSHYSIVWYGMGHYNESALMSQMLPTISRYLTQGLGDHSRDIACVLRVACGEWCVV